eukprot:jgi/Picsp_1/639/NSC_00635-R1_exocyst complex component
MDIIIEQELENMLQEEDEGAVSSLVRIACMDKEALDVSGGWKASKLKLDGTQSLNNDLLASMIASLRTKSVELEEEHRELSIKSSDRMQNAVNQYRLLVSNCSELQKYVHEMVAAMQRLGSDFSERINSLVDTETAGLRIVETMNTVRVLIELLLLLRNISDSIRTDDLYHGAKLFSCVVDKYKDPLRQAVAKCQLDLEKESGDEGEADYRKESIQNELGALAPVILKWMESLQNIIDLKTLGMLNTWLTLASEQTQIVGSKAMKYCEIGDMKEENANSIKWKLSKQVSGAGNFESKLQMVLSALDTVKNQSIAQAKAFEQYDPFKDTIDFVALYRCFTIREAYVSSDIIRNQYVQSREAQLGAILIPPADSGIDQQHYLEKFVGFFIIESKVYQSMPQLGTKKFVESVWDGASAGVAAEIGASLDESCDLESIIKLKTSSLNACRALETWSTGMLSTSGIRSALVKRGSKVKSLMMENCVESLQEIGDDQTLELQETVEWCLQKMILYYDGLVPTSSLGLSISETAHMFADIFVDLMPTELSRGQHNDSVEDLISFIETASLIEVLLMQKTEALDVLSKRNGLVRLQSQIQDASMLLGHQLALLSTTESFELIDSVEDEWNIKEPRVSEGLISPWCDALCEMFEFRKQEIEEIEFSDSVTKQILSSFLSGISTNILELLSSNKVHKISSYGAKKLYDDLSVFLEQARTVMQWDAIQELDEIILICKSLAFNTLSELENVSKVSNTFKSVDETVLSIRILILGKVATVPKHQTTNPVTREDAQATMTKLRDKMSELTK